MSKRPNTSEERLAEMTAIDVVDFVRLCETNGVPLWLDGGWGVDALLGEQTRKHQDLDIVLQKKDVARLKQMLEERGYTEAEWYDSHPWVFLMEDSRGHQIDFHVIELDDSGDGLYGPPGEGVKYPAESLTGTGRVGGHPVQCISAKWQAQVCSNSFACVSLMCPAACSLLGARPRIKSVLWS